MIFPNVFKAGKIGTLETKNRLVMLPMGTGYASQDGYVTDQTIGYYEERAKGGAGLVIVEGTCVESRLGRLCIGRNGRGGLSIDDDKFIPGLAHLARTIQRRGARAAIQLLHTGREAKSSVTGFQPVAPSPIPSSATDGVAGSDTPRELTIPEIKDIARYFAKGALRAKEAGFDGVELHAVHLYLIAQFLSSDSNRRNDAYGGSLRNRMRFLLEIIDLVRQSVGRAYPVWCRLNGGGSGLAKTITLGELQEEARIIEQSGLDAVSVSGIQAIQPYLSPPGYFVPFAEAVKKTVRIPVIAAGGIDLELGERILKEGKADFVGIGRGMIADPGLPRKTASGTLDDITPCIKCMQCTQSIFSGVWSESLQCTVNANVGKEREYARNPRKSKRVLIVGGGPAGMEAARVAVACGHQVILYERSQELGGQLLIASKPPHKDDIAALARYLEKQVRKLPVDIQLGKAIDPVLVDSIKPDVVILATGTVPIIPEIPGITRDNVVTAGDVLSGKMEVGQRVAVIGGELVGCETALFLAEQGKKVAILRRRPEMATTVMARIREPLLQILNESGVSMHGGVKYNEITDRGLVITAADGRKQTIEADTIVLAAGASPNRELTEALQGTVPELHLAGDCIRPGNVFHAIHDGYHVARQL